MQGDETGTTDLLAHGPDRDPWRPGRRMLRATAAGLVVAAVAAGAVAWVRSVQHEHALDAASRADARFSTGFSPISGGPHTVSVALNYLGHDVIRIDRVQLPYPGNGPVHVGQRLGPGQAANVDLPDVTPCAPSLYDEPLRVLEVTATTSRGLHVTRRIALDADARHFVNDAARQRCGYLTATEALASSVTYSSVAGRAMTITYDLSDLAVVPLRLLRLQATPGLVVNAHGLPLTLPAMAYPGGLSVARPLTVSLRIRDCDAMWRAVNGLGLGLSLTATVSLAGHTGVVELPLSALDGVPVDLPPAAGSDPLSRLLSSCPPTPRRPATALAAP